MQQDFDRISRREAPKIVLDIVLLSATAQVSDMYVYHFHCVHHGYFSVVII